MALFENITVKFANGNRYGLIGANGCGKSTFMKILGGDLEQSGGQVMLEPNMRLGKLKHDQFEQDRTAKIAKAVISGALFAIEAAGESTWVGMAAAIAATAIPTGPVIPSNAGMKRARTPVSFVINPLTIGKTAAAASIPNISGIAAFAI